MNARDHSIASVPADTNSPQPPLSSIWKPDFTRVPPTARRAARYVLQLLQAERLSGSDAEFDVDSAWKIVEPLIDMKAAKAVFDALESDEENPIKRLKESQTLLLTQFQPSLLERLAHEDGEAPTLHCISILAETLGLTVTEIALLDFLEKRLSVRGFLEFLREFCNQSELQNCSNLVTMLNTSEPEMRKALARKSSLHEMQLIVRARHSLFDLEDFVAPSEGLVDILSAAPTTTQELADFLVEVAPAPVLSLDDFPHLAAAGRRLVSTLGRAAQNGVVGVNGLLFGPPGTGKTEFSLAVAQAAGLTLYRVRTTDDDGDGMGRQGRLTAYLIAQRMLKNRRDALILFDEIEDVFAEDSGAVARLLMGGRQPAGKEKGWMNRLLEENRVPALWITNDIDVMDPAFLRRFLLPVEFATPPRSVRRNMVERHLGDCALPSGLLDELAADDKLAPAQFADARKLLRLHDADGNALEAKRIVREGVGSIRRLLHGSGLPILRRSATTFDVALLNLSGGIAPQNIAAALERRGRGSLCFYGPPGTGKTEFAHALADALDRELVVRRSSDLVSKYVGDTEQNIARLFNTLDAERSILFIDEVDSFLRDRRQAKHSWEVTEVNELLQQMEQFPGIFIAATNLVEGLDVAALRRFDFKLHFRPLSVPQRAAMFAREALGDMSSGGTLPPVIMNRLAKLEQLTAGDFANVCRQRDLLGEELAPEEFLRRLVQECHWKAATS